MEKFFESRSIHKNTVYKLLINKFQVPNNKYQIAKPKISRRCYFVLETYYFNQSSPCLFFEFSLAL